MATATVTASDLRLRVEDRAADDLAGRLQELRPRPDERGDRRVAQRGVVRGVADVVARRGGVGVDLDVEVDREGLGARALLVEDAADRDDAQPAELDPVVHFTVSGAGRSESATSARPSGPIERSKRCSTALIDAGPWVMRPDHDR